MVIVKEPGCDVETVSKLVSTHVPDSRLESNVSAELSYVLPRESKANFEALFSAIDANKAELRIAGYGASVTTMEEVFLRSVLAIIARLFKDMADQLQLTLESDGFGGSIPQTPQTIRALDRP